MTAFTDDQMKASLATTRTYSIVILTDGPNRTAADADALVWEHGRRNFGLRADGVMPIVCPVSDDSEVCGIGIFDRDPAETARIMDGDPAVQAGIFRYVVHPCRGFPGDALPG